MNLLYDLSNKTLVDIKIGPNHDQVDPAWQDETNEGFLICYEIELVFSNEQTYLVEPCEVSLPERYPSLGLSLKEINKTHLSESIIIDGLPMVVSKIKQNDYMLEDVINEYILILSDKTKMTIRHVYPPMTMGIKLES